jgi:phosphate/sulfate permease
MININININIDLINVIICFCFYRNIALAWLVTVPVSGLISAAAVAILRATVL